MRAGSGGVGRADDDVPAERVFLKHVVERRMAPLDWELPRHERSLGEVRGHERLPHTPDRTALQHHLDAVDDRLGIESRLLGDHRDRIAHKPLNPILGNGEDSGIDRIGVRNGEIGGGWHAGSLSWMRCPLIVARWSWRARILTTTNDQRPTDNESHVTPPLRTATNAHRRASLRVALALLLPALVRRAASLRWGAAALLQLHGRRRRHRSLHLPFIRIAHAHRA